jgi:hypothetical protein
MASTRTRLKTGARVYLERVENFGETAYHVGGPHPAHCQSFANFRDATEWFDGVEKGDQPGRL